MNKKTWPWLLFVIALSQWFVPNWNGFFFDPSDITLGEGRIISSILFIGGLILWYLPARDREIPEEEREQGPLIDLDS